MATIGIHDLTAYISQFNDNKYYEKVKLQNCVVVIDGCDLMDFLYLNAQENARVKVRDGVRNPSPDPKWFGANWKAYAKKVESFFKQLNQCGIIPIVIMDGGLSSNEVKKEMAQLGEDCVNLQGFHGNTYRPIFLKTVFLEVMVEKKILCFQTAMKSEFTIAFAARLLANCFILSSKSDFLLFINNKTIRFQSLRFVKVASGETVQEREKYLLQAEYILVHRLCDEEFKLKDDRLLPLAAVMVGNEYIYNKAVLTFQPLSTSAHQANTPSNRIANLMKWLGRNPSLHEGITCLMSLLSEPKRLRSTWIANKILCMYEGVNGELGVWFAIQKKLDISPWTNTQEVDLLVSPTPGRNTVADAPNAKLHCPKDWLPLEPRKMEVCDHKEYKEACETIDNTHTLMEERFNQHIESLEFKLYLNILPQWFIDAHTNCEFQPYLLNIFKNHHMTVNSQVECWNGKNCHKISIPIIQITTSILFEDNFKYVVVGRGNECTSTEKFRFSTSIKDIGRNVPTMYFKGLVINVQFKEQLNKIVTIECGMEHNNVYKPNKLAIIEGVLFGSHISTCTYIQYWPAPYRISIACLFYYVRNNCGNHNTGKREAIAVAFSTLFCIIKTFLVNPDSCTTAQLNNSPLVILQSAIQRSPEKLKIVREFFQMQEDYSGVTGTPATDSCNKEICNAMSEYHCLVFHTEMLNSLLQKPYKSLNVHSTINNSLIYNLAKKILHGFIPNGAEFRDFGINFSKVCKVEELIPIVQGFIDSCPEITEFMDVE
ncbi:unnamed protein product [Orchesella dallaii]|uniref:Constitutive coactivator of peroxisome proliferator-activated receptor gamma n=1 Tax=Orchesella dallaii TaxID=48710 RepID=A0ABP1PRY9_9HEXA